MTFWKRFIKLLRDLACGVDGRLEEIEQNTALIWRAVDPPFTVSANEQPIKVVTSIPTELLPDNSTRNTLIIQNIGIYPCYIRLGDALAKENFHFALAPDSREKQGNGGSIELKGWHGRVFAFCDEKTKVSVLEY